MKTVTFYSFKGGVGRSLSLLNCAYQLSHHRALRIGLLDLDVEASGLNHILKVAVPEDRDLLALVDPRNRDISALEQFVVDIRFDRRETPRVFLLPTVADSVRLDQITWDLCTHHFLTDDLIPTFGRLFKLDYLFIDARSGLAEFSTSALKAADLEVLVCRLDSQNRYGLKRIVEVCRAASKPFRIVVCGCPDKGRDRALPAFRRAIGATLDHVLPYEPSLYFGERIMSRTDPAHRLSRGYAALAEDIREALNEIR